MPPPSMPPMGGARPSGSPPTLDPNNPLAAVAKPFVQSRVPAAPAHVAQRIEVDEVAVQQASRGGFKKGAILGAFLAMLLGGLGYATGMAVDAGKVATRESATPTSSRVISTRPRTPSPPCRRSCKTAARRSSATASTRPTSPRRSRE